MPDSKSSFSGIKSALLFGTGLAIGVLLAIATYDAVSKRTLSSNSIEKDSAVGSIESPAVHRDIDKHGEFVEIAGLEPNMASQSALDQLLLSATQEQLSELLNQSLQIPFFSRAWRARVQDTIVRRLSDLDPLETLAFIAELPTVQEKNLAISVFKEWSITDLEGLVAHMQTLESPLKQIALKQIMVERDDLSEEQMLEIGDQVGLKRIAIASIVDGETRLLLENPESAWKQATTDSVVDEMQLELLFDIGQTLIDQAGLASLAPLLSSNRDWIGNYVLLSVASSFSSSDPLSSFKQIEKLTGSGGDQLRTAVVKAWARVDPLAALDYLSDWSVANERDNLLLAVVEVWASSDPNRIVQHIQQLPTPVQSLARNRAIESLGKTDPYFALRLIKSEANGFSWQPHLYTLFSAWRESDVENAVEWLMSETEFPNEQEREMLIGSTISHMGRSSDPNEAFIFTRQFMDDFKNRTNADFRLHGEHPGVHIIGSLSWVDRELAISFVSNIPEEDRISAYRRIGRDLTASRNFEMALEVANLVSEKNRLEYQRSVVNSWVQEVPADLVAKLENLPNAHLQRYAAQCLYNTHLTGGSFYNELLEEIKPYISNDDLEAIETGFPLIENSLER